MSSDGFEVQQACCAHVGGEQQAFDPACRTLRPFFTVVEHEEHLVVTQAGSAKPPDCARAFARRARRRRREWLPNPRIWVSDRAFGYGCRLSGVRRAGPVKAVGSDLAESGPLVSTPRTKGVGLADVADQSEVLYPDLVHHMHRDAAIHF